MMQSDQLVEQLLDGLQQAAHVITPNFVRTMPQAYFDDTTEAMRLAHLKAILAAEASGSAQTVMVRDTSGRHFTFISNQNFPGQLSDYVRRLPRDLPLTSAQVYTAADGKRVIDIFHFAEHVAYDPGDPSQRRKAVALGEYLDRERTDLASDLVERHLASCDAGYLLQTPEDQLLRHLRMATEIRERGHVMTQIERYHDAHIDRLTVGIAGHEPRDVFERASQLLGRCDVDIQRAHLDSFRAQGDDITLLTFVISHRGESLQQHPTLWSQIDFLLRRLPYFDDEVWPLADSVTQGDLVQAELLLALAHLVHQKLVVAEPLRFSRERILAALRREPTTARIVLKRFIQRFTPDRETLAPTTSLALTDDIDSPDARLIFETLLAAVEATLRTNLWLADRQGLALRIAPDFLAAGDREEVPYGVFFVSGNAFDAFHVRFRDIARGGVRIVRPRGEEQFALEAERHYDEAYGLAYAQQFKNKDIPEGGSKAVILARPNAAFDQVGKAFADCLLDLIIPDPQLQHLHADYLRRDELLYLGPDENISDKLIAWIVERARLRGHPMPDAFMSSKAGAGINHKQYGVTSEGVTVFLEHALRAVGIDPRSQRFTVKMTGGPDGDVAGNEILILDREYGDNVRILAIADGSGCAEDPDGLAMDQLKRLVRDGLPIAAFDPACLSAGGRVTPVEQAGGIAARNSLHNRVIADAFIPAGGRPATINGNNWQAYLTAGGDPSSKVIVEGANLFVTPEARAQLSALGAVIIKDSSANKAGVICSSFEIVASMLLDEQTFLALKEDYVGEVLIKLRGLADLEARSLFNERLHKPGVHLPVLSERLSLVINRAADAIDAAIDGLQQRHTPLLNALVVEHLPPSLFAACGERVFADIPRPYLSRIVASSLGSRMVYREGLDWIESMPADAIAALAERYLVQEASIRDLVCEVSASDLPDRERVATLLAAGGVAVALRT